MDQIPRHSCWSRDLLLRAPWKPWKEQSRGHAPCASVLARPCALMSVSARLTATVTVQALCKHAVHRLQHTAARTPVARLRCPSLGRQRPRSRHERGTRGPGMRGRPRRLRVCFRTILRAPRPRPRVLVASQRVRPKHPGTPGMPGAVRLATVRLGVVPLLAYAARRKTCSPSPRPAHCAHGRPLRPVHLCSTHCAPVQRRRIWTAWTDG